MDEQKQKVTSVDRETGETKEVTLVLDHDGHSGGMKYSIEREDANETTEQ